MIDWNAIRSAFRAELITVTGMPGSGSRAWENRHFTPEQGQRWMRETMLPSDERQNAHNRIMATGLFIVDLFEPAGDGTKNIEDLGDTIKEHFKPNTSVDGEFTVTRSERMAGLSEGDWYQLPVHIRFHAFSTN